jgi:hypothetical protein
MTIESRPVSVLLSRMLLEVGTTGRRETASREEVYQDVRDMLHTVYLPVINGTHKRV